MDLHVKEVFLSGVDALHAQRAHGRFTKVPFNCRIFQGHTKKGLSSKAWQANSPLLSCALRRRICYEAARCEILITARMDCALVLSVDPAMWRYNGIPRGWDLKIHFGLGCTNRNKHSVIQQGCFSVPNNKCRWVIGAGVIWNVFAAPIAPLVNTPQNSHVSIISLIDGAKTMSALLFSTGLLQPCTSSNLFEVDVAVWCRSQFLYFLFFFSVLFGSLRPACI